MAFVDCVLLFLAVMLLLPHQPDTAAAEDVSPGHLTITAEWPEGNIDVDLWVEAPGQRAVGYSNKGGPIFNLLRDDLGLSSDLTPINLEYSFSRGAPPGAYTVNLHLFSTKGSPGGIPVHVEVRLRLGDRLVTLFAKDVVLTSQGEELTVIRFMLDEHGAVISHSEIPKMIRAASMAPSAR